MYHNDPQRLNTREEYLHELAAMGKRKMNFTCRVAPLRRSVCGASATSPQFQKLCARLI
jgi:hypothetical protein